MQRQGESMNRAAVVIELIVNRALNFNRVSKTYIVIGRINILTSYACDLAGNSKVIRF